MLDKEKFIEEIPAVADVCELKPTLWINPNLVDAEKAWEEIPFTEDDILDAERRLERFAPLLMEYFPETKEKGGIIESPLKKIGNMEKKLRENGLKGELYLKMDSHLAVAGSVKARGGIYEVLKHAEDLAIENDLIDPDEDYRQLANDKNRAFFSKYTIQVGSTGNLGLSIGIASATLGFKVIVHMSMDAKQWKKDLLRSKGVKVVEYESDYSEAVKQGRKESDQDPYSYFIDDENSKTLFLGYAVAALRLKKQIEENGIDVDEKNPLFVYIPCGVGGAPGGIAFGIKKIFGNAAHIFFVEPTHAPCVLLGMATGLNNEVSVQDFNIDGLTEADGLAVGRASGFVGTVMKPILSGIFTLEDKELFNFMRMLNETENIKIEPSACAAFEGPVKLLTYKSAKEYLEKFDLMDKLENINHIAWATGGKLVPEDIMQEYLKTYL
ncbi:MAG: D-serine ammonia-lyase [Tissierellia bacterium]|nr:D-serine ammonia-lyase [Tissierellia bacterium]